MLFIGRHKADPHSCSSSSIARALASSRSRPAQHAGSMHYSQRYSQSSPCSSCSKILGSRRGIQYPTQAHQSPVISPAICFYFWVWHAETKGIIPRRDQLVLNFRQLKSWWSARSMIGLADTMLDAAIGWALRLAFNDEIWARPLAFLGQDSDPSWSGAGLCSYPGGICIFCACSSGSLWGSSALVIDSDKKELILCIMSTSSYEGY